jgi:hypothetical protein
MSERFLGRRQFDTRRNTLNHRVFAVSGVRNLAGCHKALTLKQCNVPSHCRGITCEGQCQRAQSHGLDGDFPQQSHPSRRYHFQKIRGVFKRDMKAGLDRPTTVQLARIVLHSGKKAIHRLNADPNGRCSLSTYPSQDTGGLALQTDFRVFHRIRTPHNPYVQNSAGDAVRERWCELVTATRAEPP